MKGVIILLLLIVSTIGKCKAPVALVNICTLTNFSLIMNNRTVRIFTWERNI